MRHTLAITVENRSGELARITGLFSARGVNISTLSVNEHDDSSLASITVAADADSRTIEQLVKLLDRQVRVLSVTAIATPSNQEKKSMRVLYDSDADVRALANKKIAVIGFGSQGHAHAGNLKDSGHQVVVGLRRDSPSRARALAAGQHVWTAAEATHWADVVMMLVPDELAPEVYEAEVKPNLRAGSYLAFAHGFSIHFKTIVPPEGVNVFMVAPKGPGHLVRREYAGGRGVPCLLAVDRDPSGDTREVGLAYASAIGGGRAGVLETSFREETETDLFGEQAVLCGGLTALIQAGFDTLVEAGYAPEMAYFECMHEMKLIVDLLYQGGLSTMRDSISNTAEYGDLTRGRRIVNDATRLEMRRLLADIQSGVFAAEWMAECAAGKPNFRRLEAEGMQHPIEEVGRKLRAMMPWLEGKVSEAQGESRERGPERPRLHSKEGPRARADRATVGGGQR